MAKLYSLLLLTGLVSVVFCCTEENINACFLPMATYLDLIHAKRNVSQNGFAMSHLQDNELVTFCNIWQDPVSGCLRSLRTQCDLELRMEFEGIEDAYDFLCSTLDRYKPFRPCINSNAVAQGLASCENQLVEDITHALYEEKEQHFQQGVCNAVHAAITCDYKAVKKHCGKNAAQWVEEFEELVNSKYMDEVHGCSDLGRCTLQNEESCWKPVNDYLQTENQSPLGYGEFDFRNLTSQQLSRFCLTYDSGTGACLAGLKDTCSDFEKQRFEGDEMSLDFLCKTGFNEFLKHRICLSTDAVYKEEAKCIPEFYSAMDEVYKKENRKAQNQAYCAAIQGLIACKKEAVVKHCGSAAGEWMQEYDRNWLEPYLDGITCDEVVTLHCTSENMDSCWKPADTYLSGINKQRQNLGVALKELQDDQMREFCKTYNNEVEGCLNTIKPFCDRVTRSLLHSQMDSYDYLCGSNLDTNLQHRGCLMNIGTQTDLDTCDSDFHKAEQEWSSSSTTKKAEKLYCDALDDYADCDDKAVEKHCDDQSHDWAQDYLRYLRVPLQESYCDNRGLSGGTKAIIAIFTLLGIALLVTLAIVAFYIYKKKKTIRDQTQHIRFENPLATGNRTDPVQASAYIQNNVTADPEIKTAPASAITADNVYNIPTLQTYDNMTTQPAGSFPAPPTYSEPNVSAPQYATPDRSGYTSTEDVKPTFVPEADITTTNAASNPMYDNTKDTFA